MTSRAFNHHCWIWLALSTAVLLGAAIQAGAEPPVVQLSQGGQARLAIVIAPAASDGVQSAAATLADYLGRMAGAKFEVRRGDGRSGLALGTVEDFPALGLGGRFGNSYPSPPTPLPQGERGELSEPASVLRGERGELSEPASVLRGERGELSEPTSVLRGERGDLEGRLSEEASASGLGADEQYLLRSHPGGLYAIGASEAAVQHAVWNLLYRLGYRQFFPGEAWEVVPRVNDLAIAIDRLEKPDYAVRRIWYGHGTWGYNDEPLAQWQARNRAPGTFVLQSGHVYDHIISRYRKEFAAHPEYRGLLGGERKSSKLCVANPDLRKLVVRYAIDTLKEHPEEQSLSIEPSDGGGWCECEACRALGSPSNRALILANEISAVLERDYPGKYVGMYAYSQHSPPPTIDARPRVIISCATSFIRGGATIDQIISGWKARGVRQFGIREYYGVNVWDRDLPGEGRGSRLEYLAQTIPHFHDLGARFLSAESGDNWGPNGLGYYIATRILWDLREAKHVDALVADFLEKAFGPAREPMAAYYNLLNGPEKPLMSHDLIGRMYRLLEEAWGRAGDPRIQARIDQLVLYTRYVELFRRYSIARGNQRQAAFEQLLRHAYRMRTTMMIHAKALYRDLPNRDKSVRVPVDAAWNVPEGRNPWKSSAPWTREEIQRIVEDGIAANPLAGFEPESFSSELVPVVTHSRGETGLDVVQLRRLQCLEDSEQGRRTQIFYTWFDKAPASLELKVTGGLISSYRDRGNVKIELRAILGNEEKLVAHDESVPPDGKPRTVVLRSDRTGLHKVTIDDGGDRTEVTWPIGFARTIKTDREALADSGRRSGYFYVPRGTRVVGGYASPADRAEIRDGDGKTLFRLSNLDGPDCFRVPVPTGQDGRLWSFRDVPNGVVLLTVPPYFARHPGELLLPKEVLTVHGANRQSKGSSD